MDKHYKISEAANIVGVTASTIRYWETEFSQLKPHKNSSGQRFYSSTCIELLKSLKSMLHEQKFTIEGAKRQLSLQGKSTNILTTSAKDNNNQNNSRLSTDEIKYELQSIINILR